MVVYNKLFCQALIIYTWKQVENFDKPEQSFLIIFLYKSIVKHGVVCHEKPEFQAYA